MDVLQIEKIVEQVKMEEAGAFDKLYELSNPIIISKLRCLGASENDLDDMKQEIMIKIYYHIDQLQNSTCYLSWLTKIITSSFYNFMRKQQIFIPLDCFMGFVETREYMLPNCVEKLEQERILQEALDPLKPKLRHVMTKFYLEQKSELEIAQEMNIPHGTVKSRLYAARNKIKNQSCRIYRNM